MLPTKKLTIYNFVLLYYRKNVGKHNMREPKITYKTVVLDMDKLKELATEPNSWHLAYAVPATHEIVIHKYKLHDALAILPEIIIEPIIQIIDHMNARTPECLAHEMHHLHNWEVDIINISKTLYEQIELYFMDELSAMAAGSMHNIKHPSPEQVAANLHDSSEQYLSTNSYINKYINNLTPVFEQYIKYGRSGLLKLQNEIYLNAPALLYSEHFQSTIKHFLTYNNNCMLDEPNLAHMKKTSDWTYFKQNIDAIRRDHFKQLHDAIEYNLKHTR